MAPQSQQKRSLPKVLTIAILLLGGCFGGSLCYKYLLHTRQVQTNERFCCCAGNLKNYSNALEQFAAENRGQWPKTLEDLRPRYLPELPVCPENQQVPHYQTNNLTGNGIGGFLLSCGTSSHPQYTSQEGLIVK